MNRRNFFKYTASGIILPTVVSSLNAQEVIKPAVKKYFPVDAIENAKASIEKKEDKFLTKEYIEAFYSVRKRLNAVQRHVGHGNFNVLGFDDMLFIGRNVSKVGRFTQIELEFIESIFYYNPSSHGFFGDRVTYNLTERIQKKYIKKIPYSGHFLYQGKPLETFERMKKDVGPNLILTSGVRSVVKQLKLFLDKIARTKMNISKASRSIAPPAFTYHSIGDFDVGKKGFGYDNFTARFALTQEFTKMKKLKYIDIRYAINNRDGVRYEPWHVKTV